eukprot:401386-Alexandrium_andersonii.AAC.1
MVRRTQREPRRRAACVARGHARARAKVVHHRTAARVLRVPSADTGGTRQMRCIIKACASTGAPDSTRAAALRQICWARTPTSQGE